MNETYSDGCVRSFLIKGVITPSDRDGSLMMHKESPPDKNPFLDDLDKLDVSISGGNETDKQLNDTVHNIFHQDIVLRVMPSHLQ